MTLLVASNVVMVIVPVLLASVQYCVRLEVEGPDPYIPVFPAVVEAPLSVTVPVAPRLV